MSNPNANVDLRNRRPLGLSLLAAGFVLMAAPMAYMAEYASPDAKAQVSSYTNAATVAFGGLVLCAIGWSLSNFASPLSSLAIPVNAAVIRCRKCRSLESTQLNFCSACDAPL